MIGRRWLGGLACAVVAACGGSDGGTGAATDAGAGGSTAGAGGSSAGAAGSAGAGTGGTAGAGGVDAGTAGSGGGGDAGPLGEPIAAPFGVWTWVDFPDAFCANGEATGIGVNLAAPGAPALIFLMGGGGCWDEESCYVDQLAANIESGFDAQSFQALAASLGAGPFDRSSGENPFKDAHHVVVPYCTGDVHAGAAVQSYGGKPTHHVGYENLGAFLQRLVPTFAGSSRVVLAGTSAGGFGAILNAHRTQLAFGSVRVDTIDDAGPWLYNPYLPETLEQKLRTAWGLAQTLPASCAGCANELGAIYGFAASAHPGSRFALLTHSQDDVVKSYMGLDDAGFAAGLTELQQSFAPHDNLHYFEHAGSGHGLLGKSWGSSGAGAWLTDMLSDAPGWQSVEP
jgi:hypothetical protein